MRRRLSIQALMRIRRAGFLPALLALGVLAAQFLGVAACPDASLGCATPAVHQNPTSEPADACCGSDDCCCKPDSKSVAEATDAQAEDAEDCCKPPSDATPTANCQRCGCSIQRGPPTPVQTRDVRTVSLKSIPAILIRTPMRLPEILARPQLAELRMPTPIDRGKHRALLSVWLI